MIFLDFCIHTDIYHYSTFDSSYICYRQTEICFVNIFDSFIPVVILKTLKFKSFVSFRTHALLGRSFRVLQLLMHQSNLTGNGK